jgi:hypothetical protein
MFNVISNFANGHGLKFSVGGNAVIQTNGTNPLTYLPGDAAGIYAPGGLYL